MIIKIQIVPTGDVDAYRLLRDKVTHEAKTWSWKNKAKTRLVHAMVPRGYIEIGSVDGVVVAEVHPADGELYFLPEKLVGRLIAWFPDDLFAINIQFVSSTKRRK